MMHQVSRMNTKESFMLLDLVRGSIKDVTTVSLRLDSDGNQPGYVRFVAGCGCYV